MLDDDRCYRAVCSRDPRFDGWIFTGVMTTGIYCRPTCPATTPQRRNVRFFPTAAAAQAAGFRSCQRCRPHATPGSPEWNVRADTVGRAMRLIADGVIDREGVAGLATRLGYSERHLHRLLVTEVGAGPQALARAQRAEAARLLLETSDLPVSTVAFASGFSSVRQFNETIRTVFARTPTELRARRVRVPGPLTAGALRLRLPVRLPFAAGQVFAYLATRAIPGIEEADPSRYRRTLSLPHGPGSVELTAPPPGQAWIEARIALDDLADLTAAVQRCRHLLDLDADPVAIDDILGDDPALRPLVQARPGLRSPGTLDADELAIRAVLGQQVTLGAARTLATRLTALHGEALAEPDGTLTHRFPTAATLATIDPATLPMPRSRARALVGLAAALAEGAITLDSGADRDRTTEQLVGLAGIGAWTAGYIRLRALVDPDVFLAGDVVLRKATERLGIAERATAGWSPWRSYALHHLWADHARALAA